MALLKIPASPVQDGRAPIRCRWLWLVVAAALGPFGTDATAVPVATREYQLKAVFLFNFAQFVDWPPRTFPDRQAPLVIGVLGDDPFGAVLDQTVLGEQVGQRRLVVRRYRRTDEIDLCHMLFISRSETGRMESILAALKGRSILTVSDAEGFTQAGGMIRFVSEKNRVRLRINLESAKTGGLTLSSKLLRPAEIVATKTD